jgi:hypothetical protein
MAWPNEQCPPGSGPLAKDHLDFIQNKANAELAPGSSLLKTINDACNACRGNTCLPNGPPPNLCEHRERILWAHCLAEQSAWGDCAVELEHGL